MSVCCHHLSRSWVDGSQTRAAGSSRRRWSCTASAASTDRPWQRSPTRAGLTERTFFRYFADKREVLFAGAGALQERLVDSVARAPASRGADRRGRARRSRRGAASSGAPRARAAAPSRHRRKRRTPGARADQAGVARPRRSPTRCAGAASPSPAASLAAEAGIAVFKVAFERWITESAPADLSQIIRESLGELKRIVTSSKQATP